MLVTLIAAVHYFYMREYWVTIKQTPIVYRYIDWSLTVPLQMIEFYCILKAVKPDLGQGLFWRLLVGTVVMLAFGYLGEQAIINPWAGFAVGMAGWASSCSRSSPVREARSQTARSLTSTPHLPSTPCASLSPSAGPSTLLATSPATSWAR